MMEKFNLSAALVLISLALWGIADSANGAPEKTVTNTISYGIPGAICWLKADDIKVDDFRNAEIWTDSTGNENHFHQTETSRQPYLIKNIINGHAALRFSSRTYLKTESSKFKSCGGFFAGKKNAFHVVLVGQAASKNAGSFFAKAAGSSYQQRLFQLRFQGDGIRSVVRGSVNILHKSPVGMHVLQVGWDGEKLSVAADGDIKPGTVGLQEDYDSETVIGARRSYIKPKRVGKQFSDNLDGYICEVIIFDRKLNDDEQTKLSEALSLKYNLAENSKRNLEEPPNPNHGTLKLTIRGEDGEPTPAMVAFNHKDTGEPFYFGHFLLKPSKLLELKPISGKNETSAQRRWINKSPRDIDGQLEVSLPATDLLMSIGKGGEFVPLLQDLTVEAGKVKTLEVQLKRFINLPAMGWWSGDTHVHWRLKSDADTPKLYIAAMADDLHFPVLLIDGGSSLSKWKMDYSNPLPSKNEYMSALGHEGGRGYYDFGHKCYLNITEHCGYTSAGESGPTWKKELSHADVNENMERQGGIFGYYHYNQPDNNLPAKQVPPDKPGTFFPGKASGVAKFYEVYGMIIDAAEGRVDFVELLDNHQSFNPKGYFDYLNLGFRIAASAGTDFPFNRRMGEVRVFSFIGKGKPLSVQGWFDGIKNGGTFITEGPLLLFAANGGQPPGSVIQAEAGDILRLKVDAWGYPSVGSPKKISLIQFGDVIDELTSSDPKKIHLDKEFEIKVERSAWYAVQLEAHNGARAFASPIYVQVDGEPTWCREKVGAITDMMLSRLKNMQEAMIGFGLPSEPGKENNFTDSNGWNRRFWTEKNRKSYSTRINKAQSYYRDLAEKAK